MSSLSDLPISSSSEDLLGYTALSRRIADVISGKGSGDGLVIGIEGRWGCGKSSLVNLALSFLSSEDTSGPLVIRFQPWLIGDRNVLLESLFQEVALALRASAERDGISGATKSYVSRLNEKIEQYSDKVTKVGKALRTVNVITAGAVPYLGTLSESMIAAGDDAQSLKDEKTLTQIKEELAQLLRRSKNRIVVVIDDLDRIEPQEAMEILRLVKAVADFPNVIYLLCYDEKILSRAVEQASSARNGEEFLEKFIQVTFPVPMPESFVLRRWFGAELEKRISIQSSEADRLAMTIDVEGGHRFPTPRAVKRALNAIITTWPIVGGKVDTADFVWLQIIKTSNLQLYRWIEDYVRAFAAIYLDRAIISSESKATFLRRLTDALAIDEIDVFQSTFHLSQILPGFRPAFDEEEKALLFQSVEDDAVRLLKNAKRLASPEHSRLFFSLETPPNVPSDQEVFILMDAIQFNLAEAVRIMGGALGERQKDRVMKAELLLDRLRESPRDDIVQYQRNMLSFLGSTMDACASKIGIGTFGVYWIWRSADQIFSRIISEDSVGALAKDVEGLFATADSLGWLSSFLLSNFVDDREGNRSTLSAPMRTKVMAILQERFKQKSKSTFLKTPRFGAALYLWSEFGDRDAAINWVQKQIVSDEGLISFLENMTRWQSSNGKIEFMLRQEELARYLDYEICFRRCQELARADSVRKNITRRAEILLRKFDKKLK